MVKMVRMVYPFTYKKDQVSVLNHHKVLYIVTVIKIMKNISNIRKSLKK